MAQTERDGKDAVQDFASPLYGAQGHPAGQATGTGGRKGKVPSWVVIIVLVIIVMIALAGFFISMLFSGLDTGPDVRRFDDQVLVDDGGHFRHTIMDGWSGPDQVTLNISSITGGRFDVYIMDGDQYENTYGNQSTGAFSAVARYENVTFVDDELELESHQLPFFLVIDNRDYQLTPGDAVPTGVIEVDVHIRSVWIESTM